MDSSSAHFSQTTFPRVYSLKTGAKLAFVLLSLTLGGASIAGAIYFGTGHEVHSQREAILLELLCSAFLALAVLVLVGTLATKVTLKRDSIEYNDLFSHRTLSRIEISGTRRVDAKYFTNLVFLPRKSFQKKVEVPSYLNLDAAFYEWIGDIPNLDRQEYEQSEQQMHAEVNAKNGHERKSNRTIFAKRVAIGVNVMTVAICVWGLFFPGSYRLAALALMAMPIAVLVIGFRYSSLFNVDGHKNDARPSLAIGFLAPIFVLAMHAVRVSYLAWEILPLLGVVGGTVIAYLAHRNQRATPRARQTTLAFFFLGAFFCWAAAAEADAVFDVSAVRIYQTHVLSKRISSGKTTTYYLTIAPWGPVLENKQISVSPRLYSWASSGATVCVRLHRGVLGVKWFEVSACS